MLGNSGQAGNHVLDQFLVPSGQVSGRTLRLPHHGRESIRQRMNRLLDQIEQEADKQNWQFAREPAEEVLGFASDNADARAFTAVEGKLLRYPEPVAIVGVVQGLLK